MSIRFNADADELASSAGDVPTLTSGFGIGAFVRLVVDQNNNTWLFGLESSIAAGYFGVATDANGTDLWIITNGTAGFNVSAVYGLTVGTWYFIGLSHDGATTGEFTVIDVATQTIVAAQTITNAMQTGMDRIALGAFVGASWPLNGGIERPRVYSNYGPTQAEWLAEAASAVPVRTANLWGNWSFLTNSAADRTTDLSGNGHTLVNPGSAGVWASESSPPGIFDPVTSTAAATLGDMSGAAAGSADTKADPANPGLVFLRESDADPYRVIMRPAVTYAAPSSTQLDDMAGAATGTVGGGSGVTGTVATTLADMTGSAAGSSVTSTAAATLGNATGSSSGAVGNAGTASATLGNMTGSAAGSTVVGTSSSSLAAMTGAAAAATGPAATAAATLGNMSSAVAGSTVVGSSASTLAAMAGAASAEHGVAGTAAATLANMAGAATGAFGAQFIGTGAATLADMTGSCAGAHGVSATASASLGSMTGAASGSSVKASSSSTLADMAGAASGTFTGAVTGTAAATLGTMTGAAAGSSTRATGAATLDTMAGSSTGAAGGALGAAAATLGTMTGAAVGQSGTVTGTVASQLEAMAGAAAGYVGVRPSELDVEISIARAGLEIFVPEPQLQVLQIDGSTLPVIFVSGALQPSGPTITLVRVEPVNLGARVRISATFTDPFTGALTDPTTPQLRVKAEGGSEVTYLSPDIIRDSVGKFHYDYLTTAVGVTAFMWGSLATDEESYSERGQFMVRPSSL